MSRTNPVDGAEAPDGAEPVEETASGLVVPLTEDGKERKQMIYGWAAGEELTEREQVLEELRQANLVSIHELAAQGIALHPAATGQILLDELIQTVCPDGSPERIEFFIRIEMRIADWAEHAPEEAAKQRAAAAAEAARQALTGGAGIPAIPPAVAEAAARAVREKLVVRR